MPYGSGPVRFNPRGEWDSGTAYGAYDVVTRSGSSYWAKLTPNVGNDPEVNSPDQWQLLARKGDTGEQGFSASVWHNGSGAPSGELGADGDYYLDNDTGDTYQKSSGSWSSIGNIRGQQGDPGAPGATWHSGSGSPGGELGADGDYYLDTDSDDIHQKSSGSWSQIGSIRGQQGEPGEQGADGATWHSGSGSPDVGLGGDGDHYLDTDAGDVYVKAEGSWGQTCNIKGPQGDQGDQGPPGSGAEVGDIKWVAHGDVPAGWMECNGQSVSASEYPDLFAKLGHTFGGDGDTFNLPDLQDRVVLSKSGSRSIGASGGEETHCLSIDEMPCHDHGCCNACGTFDISGTICGVAGFDASYCCVCDSSPNTSVLSCIWGCDGYPNTMPLCGTVSGSGNFNANWQTETRGSDQAHNNMQPYLVLMAVIKVAA